MAGKRAEEKARKRAEIILKVRTGQMTAKEGAKALGVSRKTYYEWEKRGLDAMMEALADRPPGRPAEEKDPQKELLKEEVKDLKKQLLLNEQSLEIREVLEMFPGLKELGRKSKKKGSKRERGTGWSR